MNGNQRKQDETKPALCLCGGATLRKVSGRGTNLIANFSDGFAEGWFMAVRDCFREQLDIRLTERIVGYQSDDGKKLKKIVSEWTQGRCYSFAREHILYDTPKAYLRWDEALKHINVACKVISAAPNELVRVDDGPIKVPTFQEGWVDIEISKPNTERLGLVAVGTYHLSQDSFVYFLKTGQMQI